MKNYYLLFIMLNSFCFYGQFTINSSDVPITNLSEIHETQNVANLSVGSSGMNQNWNFANQNATLIGVSEVIPVAQAPNTASFAGANYCIKHTITNTTYTDFYTISATSLNFLGSTSNLGTDKLSNDLTVFEFPYTYNKVINDTYQFLGDVIAANNISSVYDAYGSLTTPYGNYANVIRVKSTRLENNFTKYDWYQATPFKLLMSISTNNTDANINTLTFYSNSTLRVAENEKEALVVYPNPTTGKVHLNISAQSVAILTMTGTILKTIDTSNVSEVDLSNYPSGVYVLKIIEKNNKTVCTKIIKK